MSGFRIQTAILGDDSVAIFNENTQRMLSLNRTAGYLWFRHAEVDLAELTCDLAARTGMDLADAKRTIDEHVATWKATGFIQSDEVNDLTMLSDFATPTTEPSTSQLPAREKLGRASASVASLSGRLSGLNFSIRFEPEELRRLLEPALQHLLGPAGAPDVAIEIGRGDVDWEVFEGARVLASGLRTNEVVPMVVYGLLDGVMRHSGNSIAFHASAARRGERSVLLAAPAGRGKSTVCAALVGHGYEFIADDVVLFDGASLGLRGVPVPLSLKEGSWEPMAKTYPELQSLAVHIRPDRRPVKFLVPPVIAPADQGHAVTSIVFPQYKRDSGLELQRLDQSVALNRLVSEASTPSLRLSAAWFNDLANFVRPTTCWELTFPSSETAVDAIDRICQHASPPRES